MVSSLWQALAAYRGYGYGYGPGQIVCSVFTAEVVGKLYGIPRRGDPLWLDMQIDTLAAPWEPVTSLADALDDRVPILPSMGGPYRPEPGRLHLCQGWRGLRDGVIVPGLSTGHAWLWLAADEPWQGVCIESSQTGPRVWDAWGKHSAAAVTDSAGNLARELLPMDWRLRAGKWTDGVAWVAL
jgi:hypothetical protein